MQHIEEFVAAQVANGNALAAVLLWATVIGSVMATYRSAIWNALRTPLRMLATGNGRAFWQTCRNSRLGFILRHPSTRADFLFWISRRITFAFVTVPAIFSASWLGALLHKLMASWHLPFDHPGPVTPLLLYGFTITMFLGYDVSYYWYHSLQHRIGWMWHLHKVHHSAEVLVGTTKDRIHPIDYLMNHAWDALLLGPVFAIWMFFIDSPLEATILGLNVYTLRNILMMDFVRHTHLPVSFGWLNGIVICPHYHQLHHSTNPKHYNKNFGLMLAVWDRMFGTFAVPDRGERFEYGLSDGEHHEYQSLLRLYVVPLMKIFGLRIPANHGTNQAKGPTDAMRV